jgi:hypothetical protein
VKLSGVAFVFELHPKAETRTMTIEIATSRGFILRVVEWMRVEIMHAPETMIDASIYASVPSG